MSKKIIFVLIVTIAVVIGIGFWFYQTKEEQTCVLSGGSIKTSLCCNLTGDFSNSCLIGACGCSPTNSHQVKVCDCGEGKCFNGHTCVPL
jgi:hypothetical protein